MTSFAQAVTGFVNSMIAGVAHGAPVSLPPALQWPPTGLPTAE